MHKHHREINYWVSFILRNPVSETSRPHVIIVGSHADQLQKKSLAFRDLVFAIDELAKNKMAKANLFFDGFFALDCRYAIYKLFDAPHTYIHLSPFN